MSILLLCYEIFQQTHLTNQKRIYHEPIFLLSKPTLYSARQKLRIYAALNRLNFIYRTLSDTRNWRIRCKVFSESTIREYYSENVVGRFLNSSLSLRSNTIHCGLVKSSQVINRKLTGDIFVTFIACVWERAIDAESVSVTPDESWQPCLLVAEIAGARLAQVDG